MKRFLFKLVVLIFIFSASQIGVTNSSYVDIESSSANTFQADCWAPPTVPVLSSPADNTYAGLGSAWDLTPVMDWEDSTLICPEATSIQYQYESFSDPGLTNLVYQSAWLSSSHIPAPGTPEGTYYWHVRARDDLGHVSEFSASWKLVVDRTAPLISGVTTSIDVVSPEESNAIKAIISWNTNENATSNFEWRTNPGDPWIPTTLDTGADTTSHERELMPLLSNTTYYIKIISQDMAGNESTHETSFITAPSRSVAAPTSDIVINEFLPNPVGADDASMPNGEWVEIYNKGAVAIDLSGWYLTDAIMTHILPITLANTTNSDATGLTIQPQGFIVVYRNGDSDFSLNNDSGGDTVNLYDATDILIDQHIYSNALGDVVYEGKSFVRFPDGSNIWYDPLPSPGKSNTLQPLQSIDPSAPSTPKISSFTLGADQKTVEFALSNIGSYKTLNYTIMYTSYDIVRGIGPSSVEITDDTYSSPAFDLATCSTGVCTYDQAVHDFTLTISLIDANGNTIELIEEF